MALTASTMLGLETPLPPFRLPDLNGRTIASNEVAGPKGLLVAFLCPHCPYVRHVRVELSRLAKELQQRGLAVVAVNSNQVEGRRGAGLRRRLRDTSIPLTTAELKSLDVFELRMPRVAAGAAMAPRHAGPC